MLGRGPWGSEPSDAQFMREAAERARTLHDAGLEGGGVMWYDTPEHFIWDLRECLVLADTRRVVRPAAHGSNAALMK